MKLTIHRGINQIGGCITEIQSSSGIKILIDLGHNLPDGDGLAEDEYDVPENLDRLLDGVSAVFYTHYHGDHIAFEAAVAKKGINQYLGDIAKKIKMQFYAHMKNEAAFGAVRTFSKYRSGRTVSVGDIRVTPYYVSHSAADAYMFVIECDGKSVLHTGDFREHGYLGHCLWGTLRRYVVKRNIDILITEGTSSSTDLDRLASFYQATSRHQGRLFVADGYQCKLLRTFTDKLGCKIPEYDFKNPREYGEVLQPLMLESGFTMLVRRSEKFKAWLEALMPLLPENETVLIYSQFKGYIVPGHRAYSQEADELVHSYGWNFEYLHTSGHASRDTIAKVCRLVNPRSAIIPIHKEKESDFTSLDISNELKSKVVTGDTVADGVEIIIQ